MSVIHTNEKIQPHALDSWDQRKITIVSDAWHPQVNGVVRTVEATAVALRELDHQVQILNPSEFLTVPCPMYPEIRLSLDVWPRVGKLLEEFCPDSILIATEGPLGIAARNYCISKGLKFTTNFNTKFPEYIRLRVPIPERWSYKYFQWFHNPSESVLVPTESLATYLHERGIKNTLIPLHHLILFLDTLIKMLILKINVNLLNWTMIIIFVKYDITIELKLCLMKIIKKPFYLNPDIMR